MNFSKEEKTKLLEGWRESGKSISAYVKEKGLVRWTFTKWIKAEKNTKTSFVEIPTEAVPRFKNDQEILIEKGEVKIHIPLTIGSSELRTIINVLAGAA